MSVRYGNGNIMQMSCVILRRNLLSHALKLKQWLEDNMYGDGDGPFKEYLPERFWDEAKRRIEFVHRITDISSNNEYRNFFKADVKVYMFVGYLNKRLKKLESELDDTAGQIAFDFIKSDIEFERQQKKEKIEEIEQIKKMIIYPKDYFHNDFF